MKRQMDLLQERYDLRNDPAPGVTMTRGKPVQRGIRVKLAPGTNWEKLAAMTPEEIRGGDLFPPGFLPLPHPNHPEGGMVFPQFEINEIKKQEGRDLTRFDLDFDLPDHFLPEFPARHLAVLRRVAAHLHLEFLQRVDVGTQLRRRTPYIPVVEAVHQEIRV